LRARVEHEAGIIDLGFQPRPWQSEFIARAKRFSVAVVHRRAGKTVLAIRKGADGEMQIERLAVLEPTPELQQIIEDNR